MRWIGPILVILLAAGSGQAGDLATGPHTLVADFGKPATLYRLTEADRSWSRSLVANLKYSGQVVHFVRTDLPLRVDGELVQGEIYQALEFPEFFYVVPGDTMISFERAAMYSPGVGGFSMHAPGRRDFIVTLNFQRGGVPQDVRSQILRGEVTWKSSLWSRFASASKP